MNHLKTIVVIPARLASSRLPHKVLADINGHPMLWHVYQRCLQAKKVAEVHIATDSEEVAQTVRKWGGTVWMTDSNCMSGTERIVSILDKLEADIIVNVQGDQPLIEPKIIDTLIHIFETNNPIPDIVTPAYLIENDDIFNPNIVKIIRRHDGYALYFSRHPLPYVRDIKPENWSQTTPFFGHVGIYGYRRHLLESYHSFPKSPLEESEKLEQLRFLQAGKSILTFITPHNSISVDTQLDLDKVRAQYQEDYARI
ncbi:MAG: 3-deoxy-manno-octulosonate cytidylyltransferase [Thiomargarita sp.]|nr:3-deoxy-manno-octulosonate cytidylyltransferase [Thiomargarita sp.]